MTEARTGLSVAFQDALKPAPTSREPIPIYVLLIIAEFFSLCAVLWLLF